MSTPGEQGLDEVDFLISANPDQPPRPLRKVASGGELSRISLAIQVATAGVSGVPMLVYDEVDSGVSGRVAAVLARLLRMIASGRQVQVRTFHSWFAALLRSAPLAVLQQMGLPTQYELLEDDGPAKSLVWRRFYTALAAEGTEAAELKADFDAVVFAHGRFQTGLVFALVAAAGIRPKQRRMVFGRGALLEQGFSAFVEQKHGKGTVKESKPMRF
jgi:hypothetical protein